MFGKPAFSLSAAQNTGISTLYRNSYGAPAEDIKHNQVSTETKMLLFQMAKDWCNIVYGNGKNLKTSQINRLLPVEFYSCVQIKHLCLNMGTEMRS